jgi:hypothetical protein
LTRDLHRFDLAPVLLNNPFPLIVGDPLKIFSAQFDEGHFRMLVLRVFPSNYVSEVVQTLLLQYLRFTKVGASVQGAYVHGEGARRFLRAVLQVAHATLDHEDVCLAVELLSKGYLKNRCFL